MGPPAKTPAVPDHPVPDRGRVTIYDVAGLAGVSPATVSRTFSQPGRVRPETAERVKAAAVALGYHERPGGTRVASEPTHLFGLVVPDMANPIYAQMLDGANASAARSSYMVTLLSTDESPAREWTAVERTLDAFDGALLASSRLSDGEILRFSRRRPVVTLHRVVPGLPAVVADVEGAVQSAVSHLADLGHVEVAYIAGPKTSWVDRDRWRSLNTSVAATGLRARVAAQVAPSLEGGRQAAERWVRNPSSAILAYNHLIALGFIDAIEGLGFRVPRDVSIISFDNTGIAALRTVSLTTISAPLAGMGSLGARMLIRAVRSDGPGQTQPVLLPSRLIVRTTTGPPQ